MKIVKLSFPYPAWPLFRQTPESNGIWGEYKFFLNDDAITECDYWIVYEDLLTVESAICDKNNILFFGGEGSATGVQYIKAFINQFGHVVTCQRRVEHPHIHHTHIATPWFVGKSYDELLSTQYVPKSKNISIICSDKQFTDGHKKRFEFCLKLKEHFKNDIDLYGRGINDFDDKWDTLANYKYSIAIENSVETDYFTEKICDCYLAHTMPIYYGCPNINGYFDEKSYLTIDLNDFNKSVNTIEKILSSESHYSESLPYIIEAKNKCLNKYNLFPLAISIFENSTYNSKKNKITLSPRYKYNKYDYNQILKKIKNLL